MRVCDNGLHPAPSGSEIHETQIAAESAEGMTSGDVDLCVPCLKALLARDWKELERLANPKPTRAPRKPTGTRKAAARKPGPGMKAPPMPEGLGVPRSTAREVPSTPDADGNPIPTPDGP